MEMTKPKEMSLGLFSVIKAHKGAAYASTSAEKCQAPALLERKDEMTTKKKEVIQTRF